MSEKVNLNEGYQPKKKDNKTAVQNKMMPKNIGEPKGYQPKKDPKARKITPPEGESGEV